MASFPFSSPEPFLSSKGTQQPPGPQVTLEKNQLTIQSFAKGEVSSQSCIPVQHFFFHQETCVIRFFSSTGIRL